MAKTLILVIDPSAATRAMYGDRFRHAGYDVVEAAHAAEGVRLSADLDPRLVVTELSDDPAWLEAIERLRYPKRGRRTPVILCSTRIDPFRPVPPEWLDADMAVGKPTSPKVLLMRANELLTRYAGAATMPFGRSAFSAA